MWRSLESLAEHLLLRFLVLVPPAPAMFSALARPAGAALRRSFSTSAQVSPTRGRLLAEAPGLDNVLSRPSSSPEPGAGWGSDRTAGPPGTRRRLWRSGPVLIPGRKCER